MRTVKVDEFTAGATAGEHYAGHRLYAHLTTAELAERWVAAFRAIVKSPGRADFRGNERDLSAEYKLRNLAPPYDQVQEDRDCLVAEIMAQLEVLETSLPQDFELLQAATLQKLPAKTSGVVSQRHKSRDSAGPAKVERRTSSSASQRVHAYQSRGSSRRDH
jgi:hypothetical protein